MLLQPYCFLTNSINIDNNLNTELDLKTVTNKFQKR